MTDAKSNFVEQMGLISQSEGGPRIAGRIFGLLLIEARPFSLQEMADRLAVSKASASTNARLLADRGLLRQSAQPGARQDYYELVPDCFKSMTLTLAEGMNRLSTQLQEAAEKFAPEETEARTRVEKLAELYAVYATSAASVIDKIPTIK